MSLALEDIIDDAVTPYLNKPFTKEQVVEALRNVADSYESDEED